MSNFWDYEVWGTICILGTLLLALLAANGLKRSLRFLQVSLIPTSVIAGIIILIVSGIIKPIIGKSMFETALFGGNGRNVLEMITYHALALGFIASTFRSGGKGLSGKRRAEIFNTGVTTVATYLMQGILGLVITLVIAATVMPGMFPEAGILLPFGYGQGTGQALNYGSIYESTYGFTGGRSFGLTIAAFGFLSASIGGVIYLHLIKRSFKGYDHNEAAEIFSPEDIQSSEEIPMNGGIDKLTVQIGIVVGAYLIAYMIMLGIGSLVPGLKSVVYGFNFLFGVIAAIIIMQVLKFLRKCNVVKREYANTFLMTRITKLCFDIMIVAGIAAIRIEIVRSYWAVMLVLGIVGLVSTFLYNRFVAARLFPEYETEQFLAMYGMLTGTASTGIMLLREVDGQLKTPAANNLVYQNIPAMVFGFPMMLLAAMAPKKPFPALVILIALFIVMNVILFRRSIFLHERYERKK